MRLIRSNRLIRRGAALAAATAGLAVFTGSHASAAVATADVAVTTAVTNNCTISTAALAFGPYDPIVANASANLDGTGRVTITCTKGATATVGLGTGGNASGSARRLSDGGSNYLTYELYQDSGRSTVWNNGSGVLAPAAAPSRNARDFTVYGRIAANQDVPAGAYSDTVVATVNF